MEFFPIFLSCSELSIFSISIVPGFLSVSIQTIIPSAAITVQRIIIITTDSQANGKIMLLNTNTSLCFIFH